jgi:integrase
VKLFKKEGSKYWWYDFTIRGGRFRGSTKETNESRARKIAALKFAEACENSDPLPKKAPTLRQVSKRFLEWVDSARIEPKTKTYYDDGWRLLSNLNLPHGFVLHSLRHTFLTRLGLAGVEAFTIMKLAGHGSVVVSQRYVHPTPQAMENAVAKLDAMNSRALKAGSVTKDRHEVATVSATSPAGLLVSH